MLLVGGRRPASARRAPGASRRAPARPPRRPRPRPGPSCPGRRGRGPRRRRPRRTSGSKLHSVGSAGTVSTWPSRHSVGPAPRRASRATRFGRPRLGGEQLALEAGVGEPRRRAAPGRRCSLPGGLTVSSADQLAEQVDRLAAQPVGGDRRLLAHASRYPGAWAANARGDATLPVHTPSDERPPVRRRRGGIAIGARACRRRGAAGGADAARARSTSWSGRSTCSARARPCGPRSRPASRTR